MPLADGGLWVQEGPHRLCEHILYAVLVEGRTLQVAHGVDLAGEGGTLLVGDGRLVLLLQLPLNLCVIPEVALCADQEDGNAGTMVRHLMMINEFRIYERTKLNCWNNFVAKCFLSI